MARNQSPLVVAFVVALFCATGVGGTEAEDELNVGIGKFVNLPSKILGQNRKILVSLPSEYGKGQRRFPVVYLLDGQNIPLYSNATSVASLRASQGKMPEVIVIGIDTSIAYSRDTFPIPIEGWPGSGGGDAFLRFISDEVVPFVDKNYRTEPYRILLGQSNTGLLTIYSLLTRPDRFNAYVASSPTLGWCEDFVQGKTHEFFRTHQSLDRMLYIAYGADDYPRLVVDAVEPFIGIVEQHELMGFKWETKKVPDGGHVPVEGINDAFKFIFPDWDFPRHLLESEGAAAIRRHYERLTERYGFSAKAPPSVIEDIGYGLQSNEDWSGAASVFELWVTDYPDSARAHYSLAVAYWRMGKSDSAAEHCRKALELKPAFSHPADLLDRIVSEVDAPLEATGRGHEVPEGRPIVIDGTIAVDEWSDASTVEMSHGGDLLLKYDEHNLHLAIRGTKLGWAQICLPSKDGSVLVLHSSAALGTAEYRNDGGRYRPVKGFTWEMRDATQTPEANRAREAFLKENGWVASTAWMGDPAVRE